MSVKILLISFFLLILVVAISRKWIFRLFCLWYISLKYGRYSHEFLIYFKNNNLISPYIACLKDQITSHFLVFNKNIKNVDEFHTDTAIDFEEIPFMVNAKNLIQRKGTPDCLSAATIGELKLQVIGYNEFIENSKMKSMYFLVNDHFVMGEFLFSDLRHTNSDTLIAILSSKYLNGNPIGKEFFYIKDKEGNQLNFENNGFSISIKYLFRGDQTTNMMIAGSLKPGTNLTAKNQILLKNEELLDRL